MEDKVKFSENVMLIDVAFLNEMVHNVKTFMSEKIGRELPDLDLPAWLSYLALDAGLRGADNEIQVLMLHDGTSTDLTCCMPSNLKQLDGMACRTPLGEFSFVSVSAADIVSCEQLFFDLMNLALHSSEVKRLMLVPFHPLYGYRVEEVLRKFFEGKNEEECSKAIYFVMEDPLQPILCPWDFVVYSIAEAFGIQSDELK